MSFGSAAPAAPAVAMVQSSVERVRKLRRAILAMLARLRAPLRFAVAGPTVTKTNGLASLLTPLQRAGKSSFLNLLLIALHDLDTFVLPVGVEARGSVQLRWIHAHENLILIDTVGLTFTSADQRALLCKVVGGISEDSPQEQLPRSVTEGGDIEAVLDSATPIDAIVRETMAKLVVDASKRVSQVVWVLNPEPMLEYDPDAQRWLVGVPDTLRYTFDEVAAQTLTQLAPALVFTHRDLIQHVPTEALLRSCPWLESPRKYALANYQHDVAVDSQGFIERNYEHEATALKLLFDLLVQCDPSVAMAIR